MCIELKNRQEINQEDDFVRTKNLKVRLMEESGSDKVCENFDKPDILAISTQYTRKFCNRIQSVANQFQRSTCYK